MESAIREDVEIDETNEINGTADKTDNTDKIHNTDKMETGNINQDMPEIPEDTKKCVLIKSIFDDEKPL